MTDLKEKVDRKRKLIKKHETELVEMLKTCPHTETAPKEYYYNGSYLNHAYTDYWYECVVCQKRINERTKEHSWYG